MEGSPIISIEEHVYNRMLCRPVRNHYHKKALVGKGTFGEVWRCVSKTDSSVVVAMKKVLMDDGKSHNGFPVTALREIRFLQELNHPNILVLKEIVYYEGRFTCPRESLYCRRRADLGNGI